MVTADALEGISILVIDDDLETLQMLTTSLARVGASVRGAGTASAALAMLATWKPDVVLCDLHLPGVDGYGLLAAIRANRSLRAVPLIAITGSHPAIERERSLQSGFARHLTKPARLAEIITAIRSVLRDGEPDDMCVDATYGRSGAV